MRRRLTISIIVGLLGFGLAPAAEASTTTFIEDTCSIPGGGLFYADGPASYWRVVSGVSTASAGCYLWTDQVPSGFAPINWANWYLPIDSAHNGVYSSTTPYIVNNADAGAYNTIFWRFDRGTSYPVAATWCMNQVATRGTFQSFFPNATYREDPNIPYGGYARIVDPSCGSGFAGGNHMAVDLLYYIK